MSRFAQPEDLPPPPSGYSRKRTVKATVQMTPEGKAIADWIKEVYWLTTNRAPRTQQVNLGPSELGDPCDAKLVRRLLHLTPGNHGGNDGWAATVGTAGHAWLADALEAYDSGRGRFLVEHKITIPSELGDEWEVRGTLDLFDRLKKAVIDHKFQGEAALDRLRETGEPGEKYRIQLHIYGYGLQLQGEDVQTVALIAWPRTEGSLKKLFVWTEPFNADLAREALARRDTLLARVLQVGSDEGKITDLLKSTDIAPSSLCGYCPFYRPYAMNVLDGCRGLKG